MLYGLLNVSSSSVNTVHIDRVIIYKRHDHKRGVRLRVYRLRCCTEFNNAYESRVVAIIQRFYD